LLKGSTNMNPYTKTLGISILTISLFFSGCSSTSGGDGDGGELSDSDIALDEASRFGEGNIPEAREGGAFDDILFDYDSSVVRQEYHPIIKKNASILKGDPSLRAEIEGHCDKRGTNEYNLALGEERAKAVSSLMISFGVKPSQISTISYGEEIPIDPSGAEDAYAKNRRAHFALYRK
jgi:peptidoglycan-associated lipoprotein